MKAVILAAGRGTRLDSPDGLPKCLLTVGGMTLLDRYVRTLHALGLPVLVVAGYRREAVSEQLAALGNELTALKAEVVVNPDYHLGSIVSLVYALGVVDGPLLLLDGDVLFHPELLARLAASPHANALLVDVGTAFTTEEYMAGIDNDRVTALRRGPVGPHDAAGEWVGFARLDAAAVRLLKSTIAKQIAHDDTLGGYEDALASLLSTIDMRAEDASDLPWIEIDFPEDLTRASELVRSGSLPRPGKGTG